MATFPLPQVPSQGFQSGALAFGNDRGKVEHAACDLVAPAGTQVLAVEDGIVWYGPGKFFESHPDETGKTIWTYELAVVHENFICRYGEIGSSVPQGIRPGAKVTEGQQIAEVGQQIGSTMLHFEMFGNPRSRDPLTKKGNSDYKMIPPFGNIMLICLWLIPTISFLTVWVARRGIIFGIIGGVSRHLVTGS